LQEISDHPDEEWDCFFELQLEETHPELFLCDKTKRTRNARMGSTGGKREDGARMAMIGRTPETAGMKQEEAEPWVQPKGEEQNEKTENRSLRQERERLNRLKKHTSQEE
jgi:hypothetical protein